MLSQGDQIKHLEFRKKGRWTVSNKKTIQDGYQPKRDRFQDQLSNKFERGYQPKPMQGESKPPTGGPGIKPLKK